MDEKPGVIVGSPNGWVSAIHPDHGTLMWQRQVAQASSDITLCQAGSLLIALSSDLAVHALRLDDGEIAWKLQLPTDLGHTIDPEIRLAANYLRVMGNERHTALQARQHLLLVETETGHTLWSYNSTSQTIQLLGLGSKHAYVIERNIHSEFDRTARPLLPPKITTTNTTSALDLQNGATAWMTQQHTPRESDVKGPTALAESGGLVFSIGNSELCALDDDTGEPQWIQETVTPGPVGKVTTAGVHVITISNWAVMVYHQRTGQFVWSATIDAIMQTSNLFSDVVVIDDTLYLGKRGIDPEGLQIEAREVATGKLLWIWPDTNQSMPQLVGWFFCGSGHMLYVPTEDGLHGLRSTDAHELWISQQQFDVGVLLPIDAAQ